MKRQALVELPADGHRRVERGHRLLEHHADAGAAQGAQLLRRQLVTSLPSNWIAPAVRWMAGGTRPMMARAASVLPEPDSPTMPTISPGAMEKLTS